ncbi:MAG: hypothetical protein QF926_12710 [Alphaproteobacteria bacterium]|nr:hypothetical protein [Alphaproteobacteria bacterium]MDP6517464.1 hypothetical protein [Alphaproteobacteria bacterium]
MELVLAALGSCRTIGRVTHANLRGVDSRKPETKAAAEAGSPVLDVLLNGVGVSGPIERV